jgi:TMEM175 potassium channel family protein
MLTPLSRDNQGVTERTPRRRRVSSEVLVEMARLKGLSDSVVAFALTLLVLDIRVPPDVLSDGLPAAIAELGPQFAVYLLSFVLIGGAWGSHQRMLGQIERGDGLMVWWTLLSLLPVTLVPACAVLLGDHPTATVALTVFALDVIAIQLTGTLLWRHAGKHGLIDRDLDPRVVRSIGRRLWFVAGCFVVSIPLAFLWAPLAYLAWILTFALVFTTDWVSWQQSRRATTVQIPLEGAPRARVRIDYGAGVLSIEPDEERDVLVDGAFGGGVERRTTRTDDTVDVRLALPRQSPILNPRFPWAWGLVIEWEVALTRAIPIELDIDMSGGLGMLDLEHLRLERLELVCPGSNIELTLPAAAGHTDVAIQAKAGLAVVHVPEGVAALIRAPDAVAGSIEVDTTRFPLDEAGEFRSADYDTAPNRVTVRADVSLGMLRVHGTSMPDEQAQRHSPALPNVARPAGR